MSGEAPCNHRCAELCPDCPDNLPVEPAILTPERIRAMAKTPRVRDAVKPHRWGNSEASHAMTCRHGLGPGCSECEEETFAVKDAASLLTYRRQLLEDAEKERAAMHRLVRRCEKSLRDAEQQMSKAVIAASVEGSQS